jgi:hypothetical protein
LELRQVLIDSDTETPKFPMQINHKRQIRASS